MFVSGDVGDGDDGDGGGGDGGCDDDGADADAEDGEADDWILEKGRGLALVAVLCVLSPNSNVWSQQNVT